MHRMVQRIEHWMLDKLIPFARNPRTHTEPQIGQIAASIVEFGFNTHLGGHCGGHNCRPCALPCGAKVGSHRSTGARSGSFDRHAERAYIIADNQLSLNAGWDEELSCAELTALQDQSVDLGLIGLPRLQVGVGRR